jgi:hypothetical protein
MSRTGNKASRTLLPACSVAALVAGVVAAVPSSASAQTSLVGPPSPVAAQWSYQATGRVVHYGRLDAIAQARRFDYIAAHRNSYRAVVPAMKAVNPRLDMLAYVNGAYAQSNQGNAYPSSWYVRTRGGAKVRSRGYGNWLMDVGNPGWINDVAARCRRVMQQVHYDGCFIDMMGTASIMPSYTTGTPINPHTHSPYSASSWLSLTSRLSQRVKGMVGRGAPVYVNGLGSGPRYYKRGAPSSQLLNGIDGALAESWLRGGEQSLSWFPGEGDWKQNVDMLRDASARGKVAMVTVKTWGRGSEAQKQAWHKYSLASYLLAANGAPQYSFLADKRGDPTAADTLVSNLRIGNPVSTYAKAGSVYRRAFSNGLVYVNPTSRGVRVSLGGRYATTGGATVTSLTLPAHSGEILTRR